MFIKPTRFIVNTLSFAALSTIATSRVYAAEDNSATYSAQNILETVVVSSRIPTPLREVGTSVSVLTEEQIKDRGFASLADVLRILPAVSVSNTGGIGKTSSLSVRGEQGYRTMVRIDGVEITDPSGTQSTSQIQHLMSSGISSVELLRGPQGLMYGADAGGVLVINTNSVKEDIKGFAGLDVGSYGSKNFGAGIGGGNDSGDFYLSASDVSVDGFNSSVKDLSNEKDGYDNTTLHGRAGWNISDAWRLEGVVRSTDSTNEYDQCWASKTVNDCYDTFKQDNSRIAVVHTSDVGSHSLSYSGTSVKRENFSNDAWAYGFDGKINRWEFNGNTRINNEHNIVYGVEKRTDEAATNERDQLGVYGEYQGKFENRLFLTAGIRHDDNDDFGVHNSYRVSGAYIAPWVSEGTLKFKTSIGTGFRAPSLYEIDYNRQYLSAYPALKAEESKGEEIGIEYVLSGGSHFELNLFNQTIDQEIYFDLINYSGYLQGEDSSKSKGVELVGDIVITDALVINTNYTHTEAENFDDTPRVRKPKNMVNLGVTMNATDSVKFSVNARRAMDSVDIDGKDLGDYSIVDANVRYEFINNGTVYVRGENVLNEKYVEVRNYNTAEAAFYAGLDFKI